MSKEINYKTIADYSHDWQTWEDENGRLKYVSPSCQRISGYSDKEFLNNPNLFESLIVEKDLKIWKSHRHNLHNSIKNFNIQFQIIHKDGHLVWIEHICRAVGAENGKYLGYRSSNRDITAYKNSIETIRKNELQFEKIINSLPFSISIISLDGVILYINPKGLDYFKVKPSIIGQKSKLVSWVNPQQEIEWQKELNCKKIVTDFEMHIKNNLGKKLWALGSGLIIDYQNQKAVLLAHHDISERKEMEKSLRESEEQYKLLFEHGAESIVVIQDGKVVLSNDMATQLTGYSHKELKEIHFSNFIHPDDVDLVSTNHLKRLNNDEVDRIY